MKLFDRELRPAPDATILDVGGTVSFWEGSERRVTLLNRGGPPTLLPDNLSYVRGDAAELPFEDRSFDIVFSNSMIEHLYTPENQRKAAQEAMRVGRHLWIQTPSFWFPIEPHYLTPFVHWLPRSMRKRVVRNFTVWGRLTRPSQESAERLVDEINMLSASDLRELFPGCRIVRERFLGLTKSLMVVR